MLGTRISPKPFITSNFGLNLAARKIQYALITCLSITHVRIRHLLAIIALALMSGQSVLGQTLRLEQIRNGSRLSPVTPAYWSNGNAGTSNSHYLEGMSASYRFILKGLTPGTHNFIIEYDIKKGDKHAFDFLTHYDRLSPHGLFWHPAETIDPLADQVGIDPTPITYPIPEPPSNKLVTCTGLLEPKTAFNKLPPSERLMTMFNGTAITDIQYLNVPDLNQSGGEQLMQVTFTTLNPHVVFVWGGHLATTHDWCPQYSISGIPGSAYHMTIVEVDGGKGTGDRSLSATAVMTLDGCGLTGPSVACMADTLVFTSDSLIGFDYSWFLSDNVSGASFSGSNTGSSVNVIAGNNPGGFTIHVVVNASGYTDTCSSEVTVSGPVLNATNEDLACPSSMGSINLTVTFGFPPYSFLWSNGQTTEDLTGLGAGNYVVTVTDQMGCTGTTAVTINQVPLVSVSGSPSEVSCFNGNNGSISLNISGGTAPFNFQWSTGSNNQTVTGLVAGTYTATVTDANGCTDATSVILTQPAALSLTSSSTNASCFGDNSGAASVAVTGGVPPYSYIWNTGATAQSLSVLSASTYTVTVTDNNGCTERQNVSVSQPAASLNASINTIQNANCFSASDGAVNISVNGGTGPYTFAWSHGVTTQNISSLSAGSYTVTVTDANGCAIIQNATVSEPDSMFSSITGAQNVSCFTGNDGSIDLSVGGGTPPYTFNWSNGATTEDISSIAAGTYVVTIADFNGCLDSLSYVISQPAASIAASATTVQNVNCHSGSDGSIILQVTGGTFPFTYNWSNGSTTQNISNLPTGNYIITVTDTLGCTDTQSFTISEPLFALTTAISSAQNVNCFSGTDGDIDLTVSGGTAPYTVNWSTGATTEDLSGIPAGQYTATVLDANGCIDSITVTITQPAGNLSATPSVQDVDCYGNANGSINLTVAQGTQPYSYVWSNSETTQNISSLLPGNYTVTVTDANGCTLQQSATVSQPADSITGSAVVFENASCTAGNTGSIDVTINGGSPPYTFLWNTGATSEDLINLGKGTYTVTATDANGCTFSITSMLLLPVPLVTASIDILQNVSCFGGSNGAINLTVSNGTPPFTFSWSSGQTTEDISNLPSGAYTVTVTDSNGCVANQNVVISQPSSLLSITVDSSQDVNCSGGSDGSADLTVTQGTPPYSFLWSNGSTTEDINNLSSGSYTLTVTDANGCIDSATVIISQPSGALSLSVSSVQDVSCFGANSGAINLSVSQGTSPYSFLWNTGDTAQGISGLSAGIYTVTVTDANNCTAQATQSIGEPASPLSISVSAVQSVGCHSGSDGSIILSVNGGTSPYSYNWSTGSTTQNVNNLSAGNYTVTITDLNGCTGLQTANVTQPASMLAASVATLQNVSCNGGNDGLIDLTVSGGTPPFAFNWSNGATTEDIGGLATGNYTVIVTDANGCTDSSTSTVLQPAGALAVSAQVQNIDCFGNGNGAISLIVSQGTAPYTFSWSNWSTAQNISPLAPGTYSVTVTDANNCTVEQTHSILEPAAPLSSLVQTQQDVSCFSGSDGSVTVSVTGGTSPYSYAWNNGNTTQNIGGLSASTYNVIITDSNGCTTSQPVYISEPAPLSPAITDLQNVLCFSEATGSISLSVNGGTSPYSYSWSNGDTINSVSGLLSGTYSVTITDANGCVDTVIASVTQPAGALSAGAVSQNIDCFGNNNGSIDLTVSMGTPPYSFKWSNSVITEDLSGLPPGTYLVTVTDANGCKANTTGSVTQPLELSTSIVIDPGLSCFGDSTATINLTAAGGTPPYSYMWSTGATTQNLSNIPAEGYTVTVTDGNGCTKSFIASVLQPPPAIVITGTIANANCLDNISGSVNVSITTGIGPFLFQWSNGATTQNLSNIPHGSYTVIVTEGNGCTTRETYTVGDNSVFSANATGPTTICSGDLVTLVADSIQGATYQWFLDGEALGGAVYTDFTTPAAGIYTVAINHACGYFISDSIEVTVSVVQNLSVSPNVILCPGESAPLLASGGVSYSWSPATGLDRTDVENPVASPTVSTTYTVEVTNEDGCRATGEVLVSVVCDSLVIPSGYSPNNDGYNDEFTIPGIEKFPGNKLWIYNRWGALIFKATDYENNWNGTSNVSGIYIGKQLPNGTFFYILDLNNGTKPRTGYIVLRK